MNNAFIIKIIFWCSFVVGLALCIGGIWVPPLLIPGGVLISASLGMYQSVFQPTSDNEANNHGADNPEQAHAQNIQVDHNVINPQINMLFLYEINPDEHGEAHEIERPHRPLNLI